MTDVIISVQKATMTHYGLFDTYKMIRSLLLPELCNIVICHIHTYHTNVFKKMLTDVTESYNSSEFYSKKHPYKMELAEQRVLPSINQITTYQCTFHVHLGYGKFDCLQRDTIEEYIKDNKILEVIPWDQQGNFWAINVKRDVRANGNMCEIIEKIKHRTHKPRNKSKKKVNNKPTNKLTTQPTNSNNASNKVNNKSTNNPISKQVKKEAHNYSIYNAF